MHDSVTVSRIARLETELRRWRVGFATVAVLAAGLGSIAMTAGPVADHVITEKLTVVRDGQVRIEATTDANGAATLVMRDAAGAVRIRLHVPATGAATIDQLDAEGTKQYPLLDQLSRETRDFVSEQATEIQADVRREVTPAIEAARAYVDSVRRSLAGESTPEAIAANTSRLEFRIVATPEYAPVRFDLTDERRRLERWLGENRDRVAADPTVTAEFNELESERGGPASEHLRWLPKQVRASDDGVWEHAESRSPASSAVSVFTDDDWNAGRAKPGAQRLIELLPINLHAAHFDGSDLDPASIRVSLDDTGRPCVNYAMKSARIQAYADWSEQFTGQRSAIIIDGTVVSAPVFMGRIPGRGQITGAFSQPEARGLAESLRSGR